MGKDFAPMGPQAVKDVARRAQNLWGFSIATWMSKPLSTPGHLLAVVRINPCGFNNTKGNKT